MTIIDDMQAVLADDIYDTVSGVAVPSYYARSGRSMFGMDAETMAVVADASPPVIISEGAGDELDGSDAMDMIATIRVQVTGDDGVTLVEHGDEFYVVDAANTGNWWQVTDAKKTTDGLEWICECSRLARINEAR